MSVRTAALRPVGGPLGLVAGTDHKRLALRLAWAGFGFFALGGVLALVMRAELAQPGLQVVSTDDYNALFTMHGSTMIYLFLTPVALAAGVALVPLQIGARGLAGPRWALAGAWLIVAGGIVMEAGFATRGGPARATWIGVDPLSDTPHSPQVGQDMWIVGVACAAAGATILAACILATLLRRRAPGLTLLRLPVFCWAMVATCLLVVFAFPVLVVAMALLWADRQGADVLSPISYQHLFWFYGHPVVYVMFFPFLGMVAEVIATFSGRRFFGYRAMVVSLLAFAGLSIAVWGHHMFTTGAVSNRYFALTTTAIAVVAGVEYFDNVATLWGGRIRLRVPMLFALTFLVQFLIGGLTGIFVASPPLDYHVNNSYFVVAHFHYTLFAGSVFGFFAGVYYWWPKFTGRMLPESLGRVHLALLMIGTNLTFFPMFLLGYDGMTRRVADYPRSMGWEGLNTLSTIGSGVIALSLLVFLLAVVVASLRRRDAGPDPWGAQTLEWWTASPPPAHNFDDLPPVRSHAPLLDLREAAA